jgi:hypothetical protein
LRGGRSPTKQSQVTSKQKFGNELRLPRRLLRRLLAMTLGI